MSELYTEQPSKVAQAEELLLSTYRTQKALLGRDHTQTLTTANNLGMTFLNRMQLDRAEPLFKEVYEMRRRPPPRGRGPRHYETLNALSNLATLFMRQQKYDEARTLYERAIQARKETQGDQNVSTLRAVNNLAVMLATQGDSLKKAADALYNAGDEDGAATMDEEAARKFDEARPLQSMAYEGLRDALGPTHKEVFMLFHNFTMALYNSGKHDEAIGTTRKHLQKTEEDRAEAERTGGPTAGGGGSGAEGEVVTAATAADVKKIAAHLIRFLDNLPQAMQDPDDAQLQAAADEAQKLRADYGL